MGGGRAARVEGVAGVFGGGRGGAIVSSPEEEEEGGEVVENVPTSRCLDMCDSAAGRTPAVRWFEVRPRVSFVCRARASTIPRTVCERRRRGWSITFEGGVRGLSFHMDRCLIAG